MDKQGAKLLNELYFLQPLARYPQPKLVLFAQNLL